jgi:hypothetical protein
MTSLPSKLTSNPFVETVDGNYFVGREAELGVFRENLQGLRTQHPIHDFVAGLHGTGKTFYLHKLVEISRQNKFIATNVVIDTQLSPYDQIRVVLDSVIASIQLQSTSTREMRTTALADDWRAGPASKLFQLPRFAGLVSNSLRQDFETLSDHAKAAGYDGIVVCIDEGQRMEPAALSALKNALQSLGTVMIILSLRLSSTARGARAEGRALLEERASSAEGDIGAARFFGNGTAMGPFATDQEVLKFFERRMTDHEISFSGELQVRIGEITDRMPREMVRLASHLYTHAMTEKIPSVGVKVLTASFSDMHPEEIKLATALVAEISRDMADILRSFCSLDRAVSPIEILRHAYPDAPPAVQDMLANSIESKLDRLCKASALIQKEDKKFNIANSVYRYALKIALGLA